MLQLSPLANSIFSLLIIFGLLLNFVIIGSRWLKTYILSFAAQSWLIAILSAGVGYFTGITDLYIIAALTWLFRGVILPLLLKHMVDRLDIKRELNSLVPASSGLMICVGLVIFSFLIASHLASVMGIASRITVLAIMVMLSIELTGFLLLTIRDQAISKILALLVLENGIFLGSQFIIPGMPILIELVILFDLLIVIASFGVLVRYLQRNIGSTSTRELQRLVG